jgi:hypothetical protein
MNRTVAWRALNPWHFGGLMAADSAQFPAAHGQCRTANQRAAEKGIIPKRMVPGTICSATIRNGGVPTAK